MELEREQQVVHAIRMTEQEALDLMRGLQRQGINLNTEGPVSRLYRLLSERNL